MRRFRRIAGGALVATFDADEAGVLRDLAGEIAVLLTPVAEGADPDLTDPAVARLLPSGYHEDEEAAAEFRRFTADGLSQRKIANARAVVDALQVPVPDADGATGATAPRRRLFPGPGIHDVTVRLDEAAAQAWMRSLADIRLALAARLGIEREEPEELDALDHEGFDVEDFGGGSEFDGDPDDDADPEGSRGADRSEAVRAVYDWLAFVQDSLISALDRR